MTDTLVYVKNPETGRDIKVGGPTYEKLKVKYNLQKIPIFQKAERFVKSAPKQRQPSKPLSFERMKQITEMSIYHPDIEAAARRVTQPHLLQRVATYKKDQGRGRPTRGWALDAPKRGKERHLLKEKCGDKCFLLPETEGFPICPKCCTCEIDCRGLTAAKIRAHQYKYTDLYDNIDQLMRVKCGK